MSGGFADSPYLTRRVTEWARMSNIEVEKGDDGWGAVVRGAVLKGAGLGSTRPPAPIRFCPRSYGISILRTHHDKLPATELNLKNNNRILWLVRKGDYIPDGEPVETSHEVLCRWRRSEASAGWQVRVEFVATPADKFPESILDVPSTDERIVLLAKYKELPEDACKRVPGSRYYEALVKVGLRVRGSGPKIKLTCGGKELDHKSTGL